MELRLFPLNTVLFPGMPLPLNVFEPRYLQLVQECMEQEEPFGVALIREGPEVGGSADPFEIGSTARIEQIAQGMLNTIQLLARGERRMRILELHHDRPYLWADAEEIEDAPGEAPQELLERGQALLDEFERLRFSAQGGYVRPRSPEPVTTPPGVLADGDRRHGGRQPGGAAGAAGDAGPRRPAGARGRDVRAGDRADAAALDGQRAAPLERTRRAQLAPRALRRAERDGRARAARGSPPTRPGGFPVWGLRPHAPAGAEADTARPAGPS